MKLLLKRIICYVLLIGQLFPPQVAYGYQILSIADVKQREFKEDTGDTRTVHAIYVNDTDADYDLKFDQSLAQGSNEILFFSKAGDRQLGALTKSAAGFLLNWSAAPLVAELFEASDCSMIIESLGNVTIKQGQNLTYGLRVSAKDCFLENLNCTQLVVEALGALKVSGALNSQTFWSTSARFLASSTTHITVANLFSVLTDEYDSDCTVQALVHTVHGTKGQPHPKIELGRNFKFRGGVFFVSGREITTCNSTEVTADRSIRFRSAEPLCIYGQYKINGDLGDLRGDDKFRGFSAQSDECVLFGHSKETEGGARLELDQGKSQLNGKEVYVYGKMVRTGTDLLGLLIEANNEVVVESATLLDDLSIRAPLKKLQILPKNLRNLRTSGGDLGIFDAETTPGEITEIENLHIIEKTKAKIEKKLRVKNQTVVRANTLFVDADTEFLGKTNIKTEASTHFGELGNIVDVHIVDGVIHAGEKFSALASMRGEKLQIFAKTKDITLCPTLKVLETNGEVLTIDLFDDGTSSAGRIDRVVAHEKRILLGNSCNIVAANLFADDCAVTGATFEHLNASVESFYGDSFTAGIAKIKAVRDVMISGLKGDVLRVFSGAKFTLTDPTVKTVVAKAKSASVMRAKSESISVNGTGGDAVVLGSTTGSVVVVASENAMIADVAATEKSVVRGENSTSVDVSAPQAYVIARDKAQAFDCNGDDLTLTGADSTVSGGELAKTLKVSGTASASVHGVTGEAAISVVAGAVSSVRDTKAKNVIVTAGSATTPGSAVVHSVDAVAQTYTATGPGSSFTSSGDNEGAMTVAADKVSMHGESTGPVKVKADVSAVITQTTVGELDADAPTVVLTGPTTGPKTTVKTRSNAGILNTPGSEECGFTFEQFFSPGRFLSSVDGSVKSLTVKQTGIEPMHIGDIAATTADTTIASMGDIHARDVTLNATGNLTIATAGSLDLKNARGEIGGQLTRVAGENADFSGSVFKADAMLTRVAGDADYTCADEQAPVQDTLIGGKATVTGASFIAKMLQSNDPAHARVAASLLFLAGEITGEPTIVKDYISGGYQERIGRRPTFISDGKTVVLAEHLFHLVAPYLKAGLEGLTYGARNGDAITPAQPLVRFVQWVTQSVEKSGWGPFRSKETTTQTHTMRTTTHEVAQIESDGPTLSVTDPLTGKLIQPGLNITSKGPWDIQAFKAFFSAVTNTTELNTQTHIRSSGFLSAGYSNDGASQSIHQQAQGPVINCLAGINFNGSEITAESPTINTPFINLNGAIFRILQGTNRLQWSSWEKDSDLFWQSFSQNFMESLTYVPPTILGSLEIRNGHMDIERVAHRHNAFLAQIKLVNSTQQLHDLIEHHVQTSFYAEGPTAALAMFVAIGVSLATAGLGSELGFSAALAAGEATAAVPATLMTAATKASITATGAFMQGMVMGAVGSIASQAAMAGLSGRDPFKDLTTRDGVKSLLCSIATQGIASGICHKLGLSLTPQKAEIDPDVLDKFVRHLNYHAVQAGVGMAVHAAAGDRPDFGDEGLGLLTRSLASLGANVLADVRLEAGYAAHKILHGILGAATGGIIGGEKGAVNGAISGVMSEVVAEAVSSTTMQGAIAQAKEEGRILSPEEFNAAYSKAMQEARQVARFTNATAAFLGGRNVSLADQVATNALDNNFLVLMVYGGMAVSAAYTIYCVGEVIAGDGTPEEKAWTVVQILGEEAAMTILGGALARGGLAIAKQGGKLVVKHAPEFVASGKGAADSARIALTKFFDKHPMLKFQLGDRFAQIAQVVECLEAKILTKEAKVLEKLGFNPAVKAPKSVKFADEGAVRKLKTSEQPWTVREDQEWKTKVFGKAQVTGGKDVVAGEAHAFRSYREAINAAKKEDISAVFLNRGVRKATDHPIAAPNTRPDVTIRRADGRIDQIEVPSRTDDIMDLRVRMEATEMRLPVKMQGGTNRVIPFTIEVPK